MGRFVMDDLCRPLNISNMLDNDDCFIPETNISWEIFLFFKSLTIYYKNTIEPTLIISIIFINIYLYLWLICCFFLVVCNVSKLSACVVRILNKTIIYFLLYGISIWSGYWSPPESITGKINIGTEKIPFDHTASTKTEEIVKFFHSGLN